MELKLKDPSLTARDNQISSIKSRLSVSPTSTLPSARYENDRRIKKKFKSVHSKISVDQDIRVLTDYIEDLSSWVKEYFFTSFPVDMSLPPKVPMSESLYDIEKSINSLVNSIFAVRKEAALKLSAQESKFAKSRVELEESFRQLKSDLLRLSWDVKDERKTQAVIEKPKDDFALNLCIEECAKLRSDLMFAQRIIDNCNGSVHFLTQEFEKEGFIRQKPGSDMSDYLSDLKNFALNLLKERRSHIMLTESMKATAEKERYERTKFLTEYVDRVKEVNEENEKLRKLHKEKDDEYSHLTSKINDLEVKMTETSRQAQLSTERFTVNNAELSHAREYINLCLAIVNPLSQKCRNLQNLVCAYKYGSKELSKLSSEFSSHKTNLVPASKKTKRSLKSKVWAVIACLRFVKILRPNRIKINGITLHLAQSVIAQSINLENRPDFKAISNLISSNNYHMQSIHFYDFQYYQTQLKDIRSLLVSFLNEKNKFKTDYKNNMIELQQKAKENKVIEQKYNDSLKQFHGLKNELNNLDVKIAQSKSDEKMKSEIEKWKKRASSNKVKLRESEETVRRLDLKYRNALLTTQKMCAKIKNLEKRQDELMNVLIKKNVLRKVGSLNDEIQALKRKCKMSNFEDAIKNRYLDESSPEEFSVKSNFHDEISEIEFGQF